MTPRFVQSGPEWPDMRERCVGVVVIILCWRGRFWLMVRAFYHRARTRAVNGGHAIEV
jgi:hypothetical protein